MKKLYSFACPLPVRIKEAAVSDYYTLELFMLTFCKGPFSLFGKGSGT